MNDTILELIIMAPPLLLALTIHEFFHGAIAYHLGDPTAKSLGRLTLNPLKHLDPLGTLAFFLVKFGWAKPIPVNPSYFRNPKKDMVWVALAGPASNLALALVSALLCKLLLLVIQLVPLVIAQKVLLPALGMMVASVWINLVLGILNLLPIPPLDGGKILAGLLPSHLALSFVKLERYGFLIILVLAFSGALSKVIVPVISYANHLLLS